MTIRSSLQLFFNHLHIFFSLIFQELTLPFNTRLPIRFHSFLIASHLIGFTSFLIHFHIGLVAGCPRFDFGNGGFFFIFPSCPWAPDVIAQNVRIILATTKVFSIVVESLL